MPLSGVGRKAALVCRRLVRTWLPSDLEVGTEARSAEILSIDSFGYILAVPRVKRAAGRGHPSAPGGNPVPL